MKLIQRLVSKVQVLAIRAIAWTIENAKRRDAQAKHSRWAAESRGVRGREDVPRAGFHK